MRIEPFSFCGRLLFGSGVLDKTGELCEELGLKGNAVLVNDEITWKLAGEKISEALRKHGFRQTRTVNVKRGAVRSEVDKVRTAIRQLNASVVFGIGGGVNIDIAKASSFKENAKCITVPTIFATDAMTTNIATFRPEERGVDEQRHEGDYHIRVLPVLACVVDVDIIRDAPWRYQAAGFADYVSKISAISDWRLAFSRGKDPVYSEYAITLAMSQVEYLVENAARVRRKEDQAFGAFLQMLVNDGFLMEVAGNRRIVAGSEHLIAQGLAEEYPTGTSGALHGEEVGLGTILMTYLQGGDWRAVKKALEEVGAPTTGAQLGLNNEGVIRALVKGRKLNETRMQWFPQFYTILMEKDLSREVAGEIAKETGVIK